MKTKLTVVTMTTAFLMALPGGMHAGGKGDLDAAVSSLNAVALEHADQGQVYARIASQTGVDVKTLMEERAACGIGYGELFMANALAKASHKTFAEVIAEHKAGKVWGQIAADLKVKANGMVSTAKRVASIIESERKAVERKLAREQRKLGRQVKVINEAARKNQAKVMAQIAETTGLALETLREAEQTSGMAAGDLFVAAHVCQTSGTALANVIAEHQSGRTWAEISASNEVMLEGMVRTTGDFQACLERDQHGQIALQSSSQFGVTAARPNVSGSAYGNAGFGANTGLQPGVLGGSGGLGIGALPSLPR